MVEQVGPVYLNGLVEVRRSPGYRAQRRVTLEGEAVFSGGYTLIKKSERLSDLGASRRSFRTEEECLQNEMSLAYNLYNQTALQLQLAKAKVQESTPVYAVVQPATVPLKPSKAMVLIGCVFLAGTAAAVWILFGLELAGRLRNATKDV